MRAAVLEAAGRPLQIRDLPTPHPAAGQVLLRVAACGICRTDLHIADGELPHPKFPLVLGHEIVGRVETAGAGVSRFSPGERVEFPGWGGPAVSACRSGRENRC